MGSRVNAGRPVPESDVLSAGFWDAARQRRLVVQRCGSCRHFQHPPEHLCVACGSEDVAFECVRGIGRLVSYTIIPDCPVPGFGAEPLVIAEVELAEQPGLRLHTNLVGTEVTDELLDREVSVVWEEIARDVVLPQFTVGRGS